jgi:hypothetical protein
MDESCRLATPDRVTAFWVPGQLWIRAVGTFPENCWAAAIHKTQLQVWPPEFTVEECRESELCSPTLTPYEVVASFPLGTPPDRIQVHTSSAPLTVEVEVVPDIARTATSLAVGASPTLSLEEAFQGAVSRLPAGGSPNVGRTFNARVTYQDGGIVGPLVLVYLDQD